MVHLKEFQRDGKFFLSVVDKDNKPQSGSSFRVHRSLRRPKTKAIELSSFPPKFSIQVKKGANDDSVWYFLQSVYHDKLSLLTEFPMLWSRIISGQYRWGLNMLLYGAFG